MHSPPCISQTCTSGCCPNPFLGLTETNTPRPESTTTVANSRHEFALATASSLGPHNSHFSNHESLPSLTDSFSSFSKAYPQYSQTDQADRVRARDYSNLSISNHVCLDYIGHGLFSYSQQKGPQFAASSSSVALETPFFDIICKSVKLSSQLQYGTEETELESHLRKRILEFMNVSEDEYSMVFTANQASAFKLLAESYPFQSNPNLLTVYDYENEAVELMIESSKKRGSKVMSAEFCWPNLRIHSGKLRKKIIGNKRGGIFTFPIQSRITGSRYSYMWMSMARENGWHVLLDACALGPKDMETLGLSLFKPDFLICSFYKIFGHNPSGFGCLFVKKSSATVLKDSTFATSVGIVSVVPAWRPSRLPEESDLDDAVSRQKSKSEFDKDGLKVHGTEEIYTQHKPISSSEIVELETPQSRRTSEKLELECEGLDHADRLGLVLVTLRSRCLINWLVNALMSLKHPHSDQSGLSPVRIYGPKINFDRGPAVAFNVFDWKGERVDPALVQKLADRNNISLSYGFLKQIWFCDKYEEEKESVLETRKGQERVLSKKREKGHFGVSVVTASIGLLTNFEDVYRLWMFVSRFLDADFVEKERWRYKALNQSTIEF